MFLMSMLSIGSCDGFRSDAGTGELNIERVGRERGEVGDGLQDSGECYVPNSIALPSSSIHFCGRVCGRWLRLRRDSPPDLSFRYLNNEHNDRIGVAQKAKNTIVVP